MSAIRMTCPKCGQQYFAGVVGRRPWPAHQCPSAVVLPEVAASKEKQ